MGDSKLNKNLSELAISGDDDIAARHKKERKELQAKIQSLKKTAGKGDKKKKKEILEEIARLEVDLDTRHASELAQNESEQNCVDSNNIADSDRDESDAKGRISKAQKRRDKKAAEEKVRQAEIAAQEELNKSGPRALEVDTIRKLLAGRHLVLQPIPSDGDCLYNAIRNQLKVTDRHVPDVGELRSQTADYIEANKETLIFYMTHAETGDSLSDEEFVKYCSAIRSTPAWGGQVEITALSSVLKVPIEVIQATGPATIQGEDEFKGPNLIITYHRHMYSLGEHYNGTRPASADSDDENDNE